MKSFVVSLVVWTVFAFEFLVSYPWTNYLLACIRLVSRSVDCEADQAAVNEAVWRFQTIPLLIGIAAGYVAIVALRVTRTRSHVLPRPSSAP